LVTARDIVYFTQNAFNLCWYAHVKLIDNLGLFCQTLIVTRRDSKVNTFVAFFFPFAGFIALNQNTALRILLFLFRNTEIFNLVGYKLSFL